MGSDRTKVIWININIIRPTAMAACPGMVSSDVRQAAGLDGEPATSKAHRLTRATVKIVQSQFAIAIHKKNREQ